jgi:hypothetical protein
VLEGMIWEKADRENIDAMLTADQGMGNGDWKDES